jgi:hypothetical protein
MSIEDPIFALDIEVTDGNVTSTNCCLTQNKTDLVCRGTLDYCVSVRNEILSNRGYHIPEDWDLNWHIKKPPIWTPQDSYNLETWLCPEEFNADADTPTKCIEIENRSTHGSATISFTQNTASFQPTLEVQTGLFREFESLEFDGSNDRMLCIPLEAGSPGRDGWNVGIAAFALILFVKPNSSSNVQSVIAAKKNGAQFEVEVDYSSSNKDILFTMNNTVITGTGFGNGTTGHIIICGRNSSDEPFLNVWNAGGSKNSVKGSSDTTNLSITGLGSNPSIGKAVSNNNEYDGIFYEAIFINDFFTPLASDNNGVTDENLDKITGYLAHKYGVTSHLESTHTYKTEPPRRDSIL